MRATFPVHKIHLDIFYLIRHSDPVSRLTHGLLATIFGSKKSQHEAITKTLSCIFTVIDNHRGKTKQVTLAEVLGGAPFGIVGRLQTIVFASLWFSSTIQD